MGRLTKIKHMFSAQLDTGRTPGTAGAPGIGSTNTNDFSNFVANMTNFPNMIESDIYEQGYHWEAEIGGSIDRTSIMVSKAFGTFYIPRFLNLDDNYKEAIKIANYLFENLGIANDIVTLVEILLIHGELFLDLREESYSFSIIPNSVVTIVDDLGRITNSGDTPIMKENYLIINEGDQQNEESLNIDQFIHIKLKDTPTWCKDVKGRWTYGIYGTSPVQRTIIPLWWKRIIITIDAMWRYISVPRRHHKIASSLFNLKYYIGNLKSKKDQAKADAANTISTYREGIKTLNVDQDIITTDNISIDSIFPGNSQYMAPNELLNQMNNNIFTGMNTPRSIVDGAVDSSYSAELVVSSYMADKIEFIANKIRPVILRNFKPRLSAYGISPEVIEVLDVQVKYIMASSRMQNFKEIAIMKSVGWFTPDEGRAHVGYGPILDPELIDTDSGDTPVYSDATQNVSSNYPSTPSNEINNETTPGEAAYEAAEGTI